MTNEEMLKIAMQQSAIDSSCAPEDFVIGGNKTIVSTANEKARRYLELPFLCNLKSYGNNIVASVSRELFDIVNEFISRYPVEHCFETPNLLVLIEKLRPYNLSICYMAEYFLPDMQKLRPISCKYETRFLQKAEFENLYLLKWSNALCKPRKDLDCLVLCAYDGEKLIGMAGCSADCDNMRQIGIDVLPEYRRQGIATALTSMMACEIIKNGFVPYYCCAWSNIKSARTALKSGFLPAWVQMTAKSTEFVTEINENVDVRKMKNL